jgi:hypothetical protein
MPEGYHELFCFGKRRTVSSANWAHKLKSTGVGLNTVIECCCFTIKCSDDHTAVFCLTSGASWFCSVPPIHPYFFDKLLVRGSTSPKGGRRRCKSMTSRVLHSQLSPEEYALCSLGFPIFVSYAVLGTVSGPPLWQWWNTMKPNHVAFGLAETLVWKVLDDHAC